MIDFPEPIPLNEISIYLKLARDGNQAARNALISRNGRMVVSMAKKFATNCSYIKIDDLIQEGLLAINKAIDMFDASHGASFPTYASFWIFNSFTKLTWKSKYLLHVPANVIRTAMNLKNHRGKITAKLKDVEYLNNLEVITDEFTAPDGKLKSWWDQIPDDKIANDDVNFNQFKLDKIDSQIMDLVFNSDLTYGEIGKMRGVSRECIRQRALDALNHIKTITLDDSPKMFLGMALTAPKLRYMESKGFNEYYVCINGSVERKYLKCVSIHKDLVSSWVDKNNVKYNIVYKIPTCHFTRRMLTQIYNKLKEFLKIYNVDYEFNGSNTSDKWSLMFDSYCVRFEINSNRPTLCLSSYLGDILPTYYELKDVGVLKDKVRSLARKL